MAIDIDIRTFAKCITLQDDKPIVKNVMLSVLGGIVVCMSSGVEYDLGVVPTFDHHLDCIGDCVSPSINHLIKENNGVDDIAVNSAIYIVNSADDVNIVNITHPNGGIMSISLDNGDEIIIKDYIGEHCVEQNKVFPEIIAPPPIFCNSFASILKILSDEEIKDLEKQIQMMHSNISTLQKQVSANTDNIKLLQSDESIPGSVLNIVKTATGWYVIDGYLPLSADDINALILEEDENILNLIKEENN